MSYTIRRFDKSNTIPALIVNDKKIDTATTTLTFFGLNSVDFGVGLNENYLHLMEHFNNKDIALAKVVPGQLWFDKSIRKMKIWTGNRWHILKEYTTNKLPKGFVTIVGSLVNGSTVSTANTLYDEDGLGDFSYQWYLDTNIIPNATDSTYTILLSDVGHMLAVSLSYTDGNHNKEIVYSKEYAINATTNHLPTGSLTIDGIVEIGQILTAVVNNIQDVEGFIGGNFGWVEIDGTNIADIAGENNNTYTIKPGDGGKTIKAKYYFTDLSNNNEVVYSNSVVIPYAVTTTTAGPTTTTTAGPGPTTTTTKFIPDTSALQAAITTCNATVPALQTLWFDAEKARVTTEQNSATEIKANGDNIDSLGRRMALAGIDDTALKKSAATHTTWLNSINACIKNKQDLFDTLQNKSTAISLSQAYQNKMEIYKTAIDNAIALYSTTINDYSEQIGKDTSNNRTETTLTSRLALKELSGEVWNIVTKYKNAWNTTFTDAIDVNFNIITTLNDSSCVATVTALATYKTTTLKDIYDKLKVISDAADAKYASVDGNTGIDLGARMEWGALSDATDNPTIAAQQEWTKSLTDGPTLTTQAQNLLT